MSNKKNFRDWMEEEREYELDDQFRKKDGKRYDHKKDNIKQARRIKKNLKDSLFDG